MNSTELLRVGAVVLVLVGIYRLLHAKQEWLHVIALAALAILLIDTSKWAAQFGTAVNSLVQGLGLLVGGVA